MRKEDIMFLVPFSRYTMRRYSLGVLFMSSYLRKNGFENTIIEPHKFLKQRYKYHDFDEKTFHKLEERLMLMLVEVKPKYILITAATNEFDEVRDLIERIRKIVPESKIIVGGYHPNASPGDFLSYGAHFEVYGEGEQTIVELIKALEKKVKSFSKIDGLAWKRGRKKIINKPRKAIENLDDIGVPAYDQIDMENYVSLWDGCVRGFPIRACNMVTSRGCPFNCSFCGCNAVFGRKVRYRSAKSIEEEVKILKYKYGAEGIMFMDDTLTINMNHLKTICRIMKKYNMVWDCQARVNLITEEMVKMMKDSGCVQVCFGVESGSQRILDDVIGKGIKIEDAIRAFKLCRKHGLNAMANFMIGLPTETKAEMMQTLDLAKKISANFYFFSVTTPLPGTPLYDMMGLNISPEEYHLLNWEKKDINRFNQSEVKDIFGFRNELYKHLKWIMIRNGLKNIPKYIYLWMKLGRKCERIMYVAKKFYNLFIYRPLFKRSLRL